jgi:hypothetical protein
MSLLALQEVSLNYHIIVTVSAGAGKLVVLEKICKIVKDISN